MDEGAIFSSLDCVQQEMSQEQISVLIEWQRLGTIYPKKKADQSTLSLKIKLDF